MQCVIMAGGKGTRLRPLTNDRPKPLVEVAGRPILAYILEALPEAVDALVVVVKYRGEQIREYLGSTYNGMPVTYVEQGLPAGTGGALLATRPYLAGRFMVMNADDLHGRDALETLVQHELGLLAVRTDTPELFGTLTVHANNTLKGIEEKPKHPQTNYVNVNSFVLDERVFSYEVPLQGEELYVTDMVTAFAGDAPIHVVEQEKWCPVGRVEDIAVAERFLDGLKR